MRALYEGRPFTVLYWSFQVVTTNEVKHGLSREMIICRPKPGLARVVSSARPHTFQSQIDVWSGVSLSTDAVLLQHVSLLRFRDRV